MEYVFLVVYCCCSKQWSVSGEYVILNNLALVEGGPLTREDPADGGLSCLDLAIGSKNLEPYLEKMVVDSARKFTPKRVTWNKERMTTRTKRTTRIRSNEDS